MLIGSIGLVVYILSLEYKGLFWIVGFIAFLVMLFSGVVFFNQSFGLLEEDFSDNLDFYQLSMWLEREHSSKLLMHDITLDKKEIKTLLEIIKPYRKSSRCLLNLKEKFEVFSNGFIIKKREYLYDDVKSIDIYRGGSILSLHIVLKDDKEIDLTFSDNEPKEKNRAKKIYKTFLKRKIKGTKNHAYKSETATKKVGKNIKERHPTTTIYRYPNSKGVFFVDFDECDDIIFADTSINNSIELTDDGLFNKKIFYNAFICRDHVVWFSYNKETQTTSKEIIYFDDEDFLKKLPKELGLFYNNAVEIFLEYAKKKLHQNKTVKLYFDNYKIELSKTKFLIYKDEELVVENFFSWSEQGEFYNVIINPYTNKSIQLQAPKSVNEFLSFYDGIRDTSKTMIEDGISYKDRVSLFFEDKFLFIVRFVSFLLLWGLFLYIDALFDSLTFVVIALESLFSLALAQILYDYLSDRMR
ncbi:hypothetical protein MNB_SM-7-233 [hydrothermal vent metagenome]|uniref:Uncharacterized protein n=1 Tax=hydrothermal vent metagenome TaxID=652676 RepID=A0A1W1B8Y9_9ZZZZ